MWIFTYGRNQYGPTAHDMTRFRSPLATKDHNFAKQFRSNGETNMAEPVAFRIMLGRMYFTNEGKTAMMGQQVIADLDTLISLNYKDIRSLCDVIRSPGGSIANPFYVQVGAIYPVGVNVFIHNNGTPVALVAENSLDLAVFYMKYMNMNRVSQPVPVSEVTVLNTKTVASI